MLKITEAKSVEFRGEAFDVFNHPQFDGPASVDANVNDPHFGQSGERWLPPTDASSRGNLRFKEVRS